MLIISVVVLVIALGVIGWTQWQSYDEARVETVGARPTASASPVVLESGDTPSATPSPEDVLEFPIPRRVRIPTLGVDARIVPVGLEKGGAIEIPENIRRVGWYDLGVPPGANQGSAVLVAHRDGQVQGRGVFYDLGALDVGDQVVVRDDAGQSLRYSVVSRELILKKRLPYEELFAIDGPPRLTLISCGGYYDPDNGGYQDNVIVTAVPIAE